MNYNKLLNITLSILTITLVGVFYYYWNNSSGYTSTDTINHKTTINNIEVNSSLDSNVNKKENKTVKTTNINSIDINNSIINDEKQIISEIDNAHIEKSIVDNIDAEKLINNAKNELVELNEFREIEIDKLSNEESGNKFLSVLDSEINSIKQANEMADKIYKNAPVVEENSVLDSDFEEEDIDETN